MRKIDNIVVIYLRIPEDILNDIKLIAKSNNLSINSQMVIILNDYLDNNKDRLDKLYLGISKAC